MTLQKFTFVKFIAMNSSDERVSGSDLQMIQYFPVNVYKKLNQG